MPRHTDKLANMAASARKARARNIKLAKLFSLIIVVAAAFVGSNISSPIFEACVLSRTR